MRITVSDISTRESQQTVQIQAIRSWDTIPYLSMLDGLYQDAIFHEQVSNLPEEYIKLDEMAKDEGMNSLNIYDFFFEPTHEIICEEIQSTLDFYYSNSVTFRRLVNYKVERSINDDVDTNKCEVKISLNYSYENIDGGRGYLSLPFDKNGYPISPGFHNCVNGITSEKLLLDLFLKYILHDHLNANGEVTNIYANVIYKEIDPAAIAHTSSCFSQVTMSSEHELFNVDSVTFPPKSTEQIISEGKEIQRQIFLSSHSSNHLQPVTIHKMDRSIKNIAVTSLLLSSRLAVTSGDYRIKNGNSEGESDFLPVKELQRYERALPEDHPAPNIEPHPLGKVLDGIFEHFTSVAGGPLAAIIKQLGEEQEANSYKRGYHELLAFSQTGQWTHNGRTIAAEYMFKGLLVHLTDNFIILDDGSHVSFLSFVRENIQHQYKIYELIAREMLVHPLYFSTKHAPPMPGRPLWARESHYTKVLYERFPGISGSSFEAFYGKEAIITALEIVSFNRKERGKSAFNNKKMKDLFKLAQLVIHHLSRNGGDRVLLSPEGIKNNFIIMRTIIVWCAKITGPVDDKKINTVSRKIVVNNKFSNGVKSALSKNYGPLSLLMKAAINKQLDWAEKYYRAETHMKEHMQECDILGLMDTNKMVREAVVGLIHEISDIAQCGWLTVEEQHERQVQSLESFKEKLSSMNGGQQFVYGFNKVIQEGLGGLIELSFDLDDTVHHRTTSSLSPAARAGLHLLGTVWNIVMSIAPGFNALAGTSSILNRAIVENSADVCGYVQDIIRIGMEAVPVAEAKFTERASNAKYTGLRFVENKIQRGVIREPIQEGSNYKVIESIESTDFIYQKSNQKVLELGPEGNDGLYRATGFDKEMYGYYKQSGEGFYRKQSSYSPLSTEAPNTIKYGNRELVLTKEPGSETYQATFSDSGKNSGMTFYRSSDGKFYQVSGLKGGGLIRHVDKPYSELREGDMGYDEDLLDITDDSPLLEDILPSLSEDLYPTSEENMQSIYKKYQSGDAAAGETEVVLCRGTIGPQAENIVSFKTAGGMEGADVDVLPVSVEIAREQVRSGRIVPEYTTDLSVADRFSREHYLIIIKVKAKYLTRGSVSESGWVMPQNTPVEPIGIIDRTYGNAENIGQANASK
ncbi:TPA_asm: DUF4765 family protein [Salmonella enterica subsp. salamae serovar 58:d:z6]|uniref:DUF4765 family protein n=1 Tax=Salmonella enterica subsp. salamae serovar 58:d:z6 TaxID=41517 RepID=A0A728XRZ4_SALER|nr:DUF4765 family protein [Salmonella enterica]ECG1419621.1 DUF4765 family protein [Salmonella enterica subsp. salamae str. CFSAN000559]QRR36611.1 DUF4765 family protein [Salmonella enterica subsp. enterica]HAE2715112.1 DUF4765 family protein [Salmonella enterica subsp. salamae serovar 58:d:z6]HAE2988826.1 DUF4765 family protein [Salmonella enterica subsp. salamae serovar 58:d:z6]HAE4544663.1 DUF4765 family protein [Salmonella enterica subsp. salamae serovar 58:d:z6]